MRFGSVCSGIEAASVAFEPLGWKAAWFSEIEPFPSAVLAHHYPDTPNLGDMTAIAAAVRAGLVEAPEMLCGGTPCQAFSVAGRRESLSDARGNLTLTFVELADAIDDARAERGEEPAIIFWENVPGVLNTSDNAFGCFIGSLAGESCALQPPGGKWSNAGCVYGPTRTVAWRVFDAQYFGLAQRRRRVFVVASSRKGFDPFAVLFEREGVRRDSAPSREAWQETAGTLASRTDGGGFPGTDEACAGYVQPVICMAHGQGGAEIRQDGGAPTLTCNHEAPIAVYAAVAQSLPYQHVANSLCAADGNGANGQHADDHKLIPVAANDNENTYYAVRRLTPVECERLQGFNDNYTAIPWKNRPADECPDGPRYKALGNSWAVHCVRWIGRRIDRAIRIPANDNNPNASEVAS